MGNQSGRGNMTSEWEEIRRIFYEARRANPPKAPEKYLITRKEWIRYEKAGADMSRFEVWQDFMRRVPRQKEKKHETIGIKRAD